MAVINVEEDKSTMFDLGEESDMDECCPEPMGSSKGEKHYPTLYLYEIPDELYNTLTVGSEYEVTMKVRVKELSERTRDSEGEGKSTKRTVDLKVLEMSKP